jgi:predicted nucleic acid-binding protein
MPRFAVDTPVVLKWFIPETHSSQAARLLDGGNELIALDTILAEAAGIITAKIRLNEITADDGTRIVEAIQSAPMNIRRSDVLLEPALIIAAALDLPFREGMGLALAVQAQCRLVTANRTLYDSVQSTPFARHAKWVGDLR